MQTNQKKRGRRYGTRKCIRRDVYQPEEMNISDEKREREKTVIEFMIKVN